MHFLIEIVLFGIFAFPAIRLIGRRRTITPKRVPERRPGTPVSASVRRLSLEAERAGEAGAVPAQPAMPTPRKYLLGSPTGRDTTATLLGMMSGPGICTPRDS